EYVGPSLEEIYSSKPSGTSLLEQALDDRGLSIQDAHKVRSGEFRRYDPEVNTGSNRGVYKAQRRREPWNHRERKRVLEISADYLGTAITSRPDRGPLS